jgi:hypothetical protein
MQSATIEVKAIIDTSKLPFVMPEKVRGYLQDLLSKVGDEGGYKCQILLPEPIEDGSYLSFVIFEPIEINVWKIRRIDLYEVTGQGQSTKLVGRMDGEQACFSDIKSELNSEELAYKWQSAMLNDIANNCISDVFYFTKQHLTLLKTTKNKVITQYGDQLPEVGYEESVKEKIGRLR